MYRPRSSVSYRLFFSPLISSPLISSLLFSSLLFAALAGYFAAVPAAAEDHPLPDYDQLLKKCGSGCCESSVSEMKKRQALLRPSGQPCPPGYTPNMYRCPGSYSWCEPPPAAEKKEAPKSPGPKPPASLWP